MAALSATETYSRSSSSSGEEDAISTPPRPSLGDPLTANEQDVANLVLRSIRAWQDAHPELSDSDEPPDPEDPTTKELLTVFTHSSIRSNTWCRITNPKLWNQEAWEEDKWQDTHNFECATKIYNFCCKKPWLHNIWEDKIATFCVSGAEPQQPLQKQNPFNTLIGLTYLFVDKNLEMAGKFGNFFALAKDAKQKIAPILEDLSHAKSAATNPDPNLLQIIQENREQIAATASEHLAPGYLLLFVLYHYASQYAGWLAQRSDDIEGDGTWSQISIRCFKTALLHLEMAFQLKDYSAPEFHNAFLGTEFYEKFFRWFPLGSDGLSLTAQSAPWEPFTPTLPRINLSVFAVTKFTALFPKDYQRTASQLAWQAHAEASETAHQQTAEIIADLG